MTKNHTSYNYAATCEKDVDARIWGKPRFVLCYYMQAMQYVINQNITSYYTYSSNIKRPISGKRCPTFSKPYIRWIWRIQILATFTLLSELVFHISPSSKGVTDFREQIKLPVWRIITVRPFYRWHCVCALLGYAAPYSLYRHRLLDDN